MIPGDIRVFVRTAQSIYNGDWNLSDSIKCALIDNSVIPKRRMKKPLLSKFNEVGDEGSYVKGGILLGNVEELLKKVYSSISLCSPVDPSWEQNIRNTCDAYFALIYNSTKKKKPVIAYLCLGGPIDMASDNLTIKWSNKGIISWGKEAIPMMFNSWL